MSISFRSAKKEDIFEVAKNANDEWGRNILEIAKYLNKENNDYERCYVAEKLNKIIGLVYGYILPNRLLFPVFLYVSYDNRKIGVGKRLLEYFEKETKSDTSIIFYHKSLHDFYKGCGYCAGDDIETAIKVLR